MVSRVNARLELRQGLSGSRRSGPLSPIVRLCLHPGFWHLGSRKTGQNAWLADTSAPFKRTGVPWQILHGDSPDQLTMNELSHSVEPDVIVRFSQVVPFVPSLPVL